MFAAFDAMDGTVIGQCVERHRYEMILKFLGMSDRNGAKGGVVRMILDDCATYQHKNVEIWLTRYPQFHLHATPTTSFWLHLVERWFCELTDKAIRRGLFHFKPDSIAASRAGAISQRRDTPLLAVLVSPRSLSG